MAFEIVLDSGAELKIKEASWADVLRLKNSIISELGASTEDVKSLDFKDLLNQDLVSVLPLISKLLSSESVEQALQKCLSCCTYDKRRITDSLFDDSPESRADYYEICFYALKENLSPLFARLPSVFSKALGAKKEGQK